MDRPWLAFLVLDKTSGEKPYELWCPLRGGEQLRQNVTREALFSAAVVRHFFRPFQLRYCERYSDNVYKQMGCGSGSTIKALATVEAHVRHLCMNPGVASTRKLQKLPMNVEDFAARVIDAAGERRAWTREVGLDEFIARISKFSFVDHGLTGASAYRSSDVYPRSLHVEQAAEIRYPSRVVNGIYVRILLGWAQSVSNASVGRLFEMFGQGMAGDWERAELWLMGSYVGFAYQMYPEQAKRFIRASAKQFANENPAPSLDKEGMEEASPPEDVIVIADDPEEAAKKRQAYKKAENLREAKKAKESSPTTRSKTASSTSPPKPPLKLKLKLGGTASLTTGQAKTGAQ